MEIFIPYFLLGMAITYMLLMVGSCFKSWLELRRIRKIPERRARPIWFGISDKSKRVEK